MATAAAFSSFYPLPSLFSKPTLRLRTLRRVPLIRASSSSPIEFNISFGAAPRKEESAAAAPKTTLVPDRFSQDPFGPPLPLLIPWIVRDENGNLTLQSSPPARFLHAMAEAKTTKKDKKKKNDNKPSTPSASSSSGSAPKYSKAARRFYNEKIREPQRLSKVLAAAGVASRRSCEELIFEGKVTVNGSVCTSPQTRVDVLKDSIYVNGNRLSKKLPPKLYFALNKPKGLVFILSVVSLMVVSLIYILYIHFFLVILVFTFTCFLQWSCLKYKCADTGIFAQMARNQNRLSPYSMTISRVGLCFQNKTNPGIPKPRLFTVGRLDVATTGLILLTNDGDFAQRLSHPSSELAKEYIATIEGSVHKRHLLAISDGTQIEGVHCIPDFVELLPVQPDASRPRIRVVVHEGRNHEVRELIKNAGLQLHSLKRVRVGGFKLPSDLGLGKYVELEQPDIKLLEGNAQKST